MEESVLLGTKPLIDSISHFIWDPSDVFSVCHLCECHIVQWRRDSHLLLLLIYGCGLYTDVYGSLHIIKRTLHVGSKIWILCSRGKNNISLVCCAHSWDIILATYIFLPLCNILLKWSHWILCSYVEGWGVTLKV